MLSQNDFRALLSTPGPDSAGKSRFDMQQIAKFDRENKQAGE